MDKPDTGSIRRVVFALEALGLNNGVQTVMDVLAQEFHRAGLEFAYATEHHPVGPVAVPGKTYVDLKGHSKTLRHPLARQYPGPMGLKLGIKAVLTPGWRLWRRWRQSRFLRSLGPETAMILMTPTPGITFMRRRRDWRSKQALVVGQVHSSPTDHPHGSSILTIGEVARGCTLFTALTAADAAEFSRLLRIQVVPLRNPCRSGIRMSEQERRPVIVFMGRLSGEKRVDRLIDAFELMAEQAPGWCLEIYGEGYLREELEQRASAVAHADRIHFMGWTRHPAEVLASASLVALSSDSEGLPMVLLEAAQVGTPAVAIVCSSGVEELVGACGFPVADPSAESLAEVLLEAISCLPERRSEFAETCRTVAARYDAAHVAEEWFEIFRTRSAKHLTLMTGSGDASRSGELERG